MMRVKLLLVGVAVVCFGLPFRAAADDAAMQKELKAGRRVEASIK